MTAMPGDPHDVDAWERTIAERLGALRDRIVGAGGSDVTLLAVSKGHPVEAVLGAQRLGLDTFGENYAQDLAAKHAHLLQVGAPVPEWHFIGQLQSNKVRLISQAVAVWQSVDRAKVGTEIAKRAPGARVFAQVNLADDPNKAGCTFRELPALVDHLRGLGLSVEGLMGVGTHADDVATRAGFARLREAVDAHELRECSMGMTDDLELAIAEGSTMVRVGTALFGPRHRP